MQRSKLFGIVGVIAAIGIMGLFLDNATADSCMGAGPFPTEEEAKRILLEINPKLDDPTATFEFTYDGPDEQRPVSIYACMPKNG